MCESLIANLEVSRTCSGIQQNTSVYDSAAKALATVECDLVLRDSRWHGPLRDTYSKPAASSDGGHVVIEGDTL